jgi:hypothetical protein
VCKETCCKKSQEIENNENRIKEETNKKLINEEKRDA